MPWELNERLAAIAAGDYRPYPGSVGARLAEVLGDYCHAAQSLARFARAAYRAEGMYWAMLLDADPDALSESEADEVASALRAWIDGKRPFRVRVR
jgi:hypothetical protein